MKKILSLALITGVILFSCSKKNTPTPATANVIEYSFTANNPGKYVMNYYDGVSLGTAEDITTSSWTKKVTIPTGTKTANIFFTAAENSPFSTNNTGVVTIKLNGKIVATGSKLFTSSITLAEADYTFTGN